MTLSKSVLALGALSGLALAVTVSHAHQRCLAPSGKIVKDSRKVRAFESLSVAGPIQVRLTQGPLAPVVVSAQSDLLPRIQTVVEDGTLHVSIEGCVTDAKPVTVHITAPTVRALSLAGSGRLSTEGQWIADSLAANLAGSGRMDLDLKVADLNANVSGSGRVNCLGAVTEANAAVQGSGRLQLHVKERLNAAVMGSGRVIYSGPESLEVKSAIMGSGRIVRAR